MSAPLEHVDDWFYSAPDGEQIGPLTTAELRTAYQLGRVKVDTLIWREQMASWRELRKLAPELGIRVFHNVEKLAVPAVSERFVMPRWLGIAVAMVLTALFLMWLSSQFKEEVAKPSPVAIEKHLAESRALQIEVDRLVGQTGRCPRNSEQGLRAPAEYADGLLRAVRIHPLSQRPEVCVIDLIFAGQRVRLLRTADHGWQVAQEPPAQAPADQPDAQPGD